MGTDNIGAAAVQPQQIMFDSGTSLLYYPPSYKNALLFPITGFHESVYEDGYWYVDCNAKNLPSLFLYVQGYWLEIPSEAYIFYIFKDRSEKLCLIGMVENDDEYWLAGDVFLISYYQVYDDDNSQMILSPRKKSSVATIEFGPEPWRYFSDFD